MTVNEDEPDYEVVGESFNERDYKIDDNESYECYICGRPASCSYEGVFYCYRCIRQGVEN